MRCTAMLQNVRYRGLAMTPLRLRGAAVAAERALAADRDVLDRFARHYQTGEPMPQSLVDKIERVEQIQSGIRDARIPVGRDRRHGSAHASRRRRRHLDVRAARRSRASAACRAKWCCAIGCRTSIICSATTSYSAGYYSYLWSDVMAADAWQAFVEAGGPWDADANERLRTHILSDGNSIDRAEAYRRFRGRDPDIQALLDARGFATVESVETAPPADN